MKLILVGGFLGSGKTTGIVNACQLLRARSISVAIITNDQGSQQVDSAYVRSLGIQSEEVSNGCFCCNYDQLDKRIHSLTSTAAPHYIFAEAVGSCTDMVATVVLPLKKFNPSIKVLLCVFLDAELLISLIENRAAFVTEAIQYIFKKQLEEAEVLVVNKTDIVSAEQIQLLADILNKEYPNKQLIFQNSLDREQLDEWLHLIEDHHSPGCLGLAEIDYDTYGKGEAELAWVDNSVTLITTKQEAPYVAGVLIGKIFDQIQMERLTIGHLKFYLESETGSQKVSFTTTSTSSSVVVSVPDTNRVTVMINARVQTVPERLLRIIKHAISLMQSRFGCTIVEGNCSAFSPGYPMPSYRMENE